MSLCAKKCAVKRQVKRKKKFDAGNVAAWYQEYRPYLETYVFYSLGTLDTGGIAVRALAETGRLIATLRRREAPDPLTLALALCHKTCKNKNKKAQQSRTYKENSSALTAEFCARRGLSTNGESAQWMLQVLSLPSAERMVFVLREVLGLSSRRAGQILKLPGPKVESRLLVAAEALRDCLHTDTAGNLVRQLVDDEFSETDSVLQPTLRLELQFQSPEKEQWKEWLTESVAGWQQRRRRRRLTLILTPLATGVLLAGGACLYYKPWMYLMGPVQPRAATSALQAAYVKQVGFVPRLPSTTPPGWKVSLTMWQGPVPGTAPVAGVGQINDFEEVFTNGKAQYIYILESDIHRNNPSTINQLPNQSLTTIKMNGVSVGISQSPQPDSATAQFTVGTVLVQIVVDSTTDSSPQAPAVKGRSNSTLQAKLTALIRSMLIRPLTVTRTPDYQFGYMNTLADAKRHLSFTVIVPSSSALPKSWNGLSPNISAVIEQHGHQGLQECALSYSQTTGAQNNPGPALSISEIHGAISMPQSKLERSDVDPGTASSTINLEGHQVIVNDDSSLFWNDATSSVGFLVSAQGAETSLLTSQEPDLQRVMANLIVQETSAHQVNSNAP